MQVGGNGPGPVALVHSMLGMQSCTAVHTCRGGDAVGEQRTSGSNKREEGALQLTWLLGLSPSALHRLAAHNHIRHCQPHAACHWLGCPAIEHHCCVLSMQH